VVFHYLHPKGSAMPKRLMDIASEIVQAQASKTSMTAADIALSLRQVFSTLYELQRAESGEIELPEIQETTPAKPLNPEDSIQENKVICLECGVQMKWLTQKHLVSHGMTQKEYRKKYGFKMGTALSAKSLTKARSKAAKKRGLPEKLKKYLETGRQSRTEVERPPEPKGPGTERVNRVRKRFSPKKMG